MNSLLQIILLFSFHATAEPVALQYDAACIFQAVAVKMRVTIRTDYALPMVKLSSETSLKEFQDLIESEWNVRPEVVTNVYLPKSNVIFLANEIEYKNSRSLDDALAHELTHFVQRVYEGDRDGSADAVENQAVRVQTWFREVFMATGQSPCASPELVAGTP